MQRIEIVDGCWNYTGFVKRDGYGVMYVGLPTKMLAHRVSYEAHVGPIPDGKHVLHHCDNRRCVNPDHLYIGTDADNARDRVIRCREGDRRGVINGASKITENDVREIRRLRASGMTTVAIAERFPINNQSVSNICTGKNWRHVT